MLERHPDAFFAHLSASGDITNTGVTRTVFELTETNSESEFVQLLERFNVLKELKLQLKAFKSDFPS